MMMIAGKLLKLISQFMILNKVSLIISQRFLEYIFTNPIQGPKVKVVVSNNSKE